MAILDLFLPKLHKCAFEGLKMHTLLSCNIRSSLKSWTFLLQYPYIKEGYLVNVSLLEINVHHHLHYFLVTETVMGWFRFKWALLTFDHSQVISTQRIYMGSSSIHIHIVCHKKNWLRIFLQIKIPMRQCQCSYSWVFKNAIKICSFG